ncbi:EutN/CcmL family microcompartment protein [Anaerococcus sp. AGMB09787]|uniref:EutN/CcmL family microcompartment protein n=1 Tax=Anaerococcus sp. AGMB09787 TaxID=2922869 RepID=UPI001FAFDB0B|nr:EutN/CcmL family microcompartment protein [Anaerococcus sp. AGMB09787]
MFIAKVIGNVVATTKSNTLQGTKLMIVQKHNVSDDLVREEFVAVDYVGAGIGESVLVASGSAVRVESERKASVIDLAIVGIIDEIIS